MTVATGDPLVRGDGETLKLTITNPDKSVRNITNDTIKCSLKKSIYDTVPILTKSSVGGGGIIKTNTAQGLAEVTINPADLLPLNREQMLHGDVEVTDSSGKPATTRFTVPFVLGITD